MTIATLSRVLLPPSNPIEAVGAWLPIEEALGVELPGDFKSYIECYGSGVVGNFLSVLNPFSVRTSLNFVEQSRRHLEVLRELHEEFGEPNPFNLYPCEGGLLPVAITDNGDVVHWLTEGGAAEWTIVVNEARSPDYQQFSCDLTDFLAGLIDGSIVCRAFPSSAFNGYEYFRSL